LDHLVSLHLEHMLQRLLVMYAALSY
jgi:hypothetical protein